MSRWRRTVGKIRRPNSRKGRVVRGAVLVGTTLTVAGLIWLVFFSPWLVLRTVTVQGVALVSVEAVESAAQAPLGTPLARVSERAVAERVAGLPEVERVTVSRRWPTTLAIRVSERQPVLFSGSEPNTVLIDQAGAIFPGAPPEGVLEARGPLDDAGLLSGVASLVQAFPAELKESAVLVEYTSADAITVRTADDREIFFGSADLPDAKAEVALALVRGTRADHIDVSAPSRPSTR